MSPVLVRRRHWRARAVDGRTGAPRTTPWWSSPQSGVERSRCLRTSTTCTSSPWCSRADGPSWSATALSWSSNRTGARLHRGPGPRYSSRLLAQVDVVAKRSTGIHGGCRARGGGRLARAVHRATFGEVREQSSGLAHVGVTHDQRGGDCANPTKDHQATSGRAVIRPVASRDGYRPADDTLAAVRRVP
jgi:hypothetical protein